MASITKEPGGRRTIQFVGGDGKRRSIRLGKVPAKVAEAFKVRVETLVAVCFGNSGLDAETSKWVAGLDPKTADKLARVGLIPKRHASRLSEFLESYISGRTDVKPLSVVMMRQTQGDLVNFFGPDKLLHTITAGDAEAWRLWLVKRKLADNTIRRRCGRAKQFFAVAVRHKLVPENPFVGLKSAVQGNPARYAFVTPEDAQKVLDACPDAEWRLLFALSRYGGLRCPSEHLGLRWSDIDWERGRMTVHSPKTEHHAGRASRVVPIFPELRPYLEEAWDVAEPGAEYVIARYRDRNSNLRTQLTRIIERAGLEAWPKLFQNLRSSRQTELVERFPTHVVCAWLGNTVPVAAKHYLQVTDEHYEKAVQNPVQSASESLRPRRSPSKISAGNEALRCLTIKQIAEAGLEPARGCIPHGILNPVRLPFRHSADPVRRVRSCSTRVPPDGIGSLRSADR